MRRRKRAQALALDYQVGEVSFTGAGTLAASLTSPVTFIDVQLGDGILVLAEAPSQPSAPASNGRPSGVTDTAGNAYVALNEMAWEASPPNVNEGAYATLYFCQTSGRKLTHGVDSVTVTWDNPVFDRVVSVWAIHHGGGAAIPNILASTSDNDAAIFAASQVKLGATSNTPARDKTLYMAIILAEKVGGVGSFGGVGGYNGFFQAQFRAFTGSKQTYLRNCQTFGADAYLIVGAAHPQYELDVGTLLAGVSIPSFNGVGQNYSAGANAWKGIIILSFE